jgi:hypothetical protein
VELGKIIAARHTMGTWLAANKPLTKRFNFLPLLLQWPTLNLDGLKYAVKTFLHKTEPGIKDPLIKLAPTLKKRVVKHKGADICILTAGLDSRMVRLTLRLH